MRRHRIEFEQFRIFVYTVHAGENRLMKTDEWNRSLKQVKDGYQLLSPISLFTKGSFVCYRGDDVPFEIQAGDGAWPHARTDVIKPFRLIAKEESEYHCIVPKQDTDKWWWRDRIQKDSQQKLPPNSYVYLAQGPIIVNGTSYTGPNLIKIDDPAASYISGVDTIACVTSNQIDL